MYACDMCGSEAADILVQHSGEQVHLCRDCAAAQGIEICQICETKQATIHLTNIENNVKKEVHICESCAVQKGVTLQSPVALPDLIDGVGATNEMSSVGGSAPTAEPSAVDNASLPACPECDVSWGTLEQTGRFGCPHDFTFFRERVRGLLERVHNGLSEHVGRRPEGQVDERRDALAALDACRLELEQAVAEEKYEVAARLRDEIAALTRSIGEHQS